MEVEDGDPTSQSKANTHHPSHDPTLYYFKPLSAETPDTRKPKSVGQKHSFAQEEPINREYVAGSRKLLNNITISRDQTAASNFRNEQLLALQQSLPLSNESSEVKPVNMISLMDDFVQDIDDFVQDWDVDEGGQVRHDRGLSRELPRIEHQEALSKPQAERTHLASKAERQEAQSENSTVSGLKSLKRTNLVLDEDGGKRTLPPIDVALVDNIRGKYCVPKSTAPTDFLSIASLTQQGTGLPSQISNDGALVQSLQHPQPDFDTMVRPISKQDHLAHIAELEKENSILKNMVEKNLTPPNMQILHYPYSSKTPYLGEPYWIRGLGRRYALTAERPVGDLNAYLHDHGEINFVVHKYYDDHVPPHLDRRGLLGKEVLSPPTPVFEAITLVSGAMRFAVKTFLQKQPNFHQDFPKFRLEDDIPAPYIFWYRYRQTPTLLEPGQSELLQSLSGWIERNYGQHYVLANSLLAKNRVSPRTVQYLIRPGDVLVSNEAGHMRAYLATSWASESKLEPKDVKHNLPFPNSTSKKGNWRWTVQAWAYRYNGALDKVHFDLEITLFVEGLDDEVNMKELNIIPLRFASEDLQAKLRLRGKTFWNCRDKRHVSYRDGDKASNEDGERFMIDYSTYKQLHPESAVFTKLQPGNITAENRVMEENEPSKPPNVYLFPPTITAYNLRQKKWMDLDVDLIREVEWNKQAFRDLVIDPDTKEMVQALITNQLEAEKGTDIIRGKGNGLIILLHGGPGTGKTFTAESVAEMAEKPLYRVTCGDIGTQPEEVEKYLESVLHLGKIWGCVVLLDEADVFLEERSLTDLRRNAPVSVFLRVLEYYDGILILTSNRVGTFDEAFKSRIQLPLHYESLGESQRRKIWLNFFSHLRSFNQENIDFDDLDLALDELVSQALNGRQIRNAITTARQLARFKGVKMSSEHLKRAIKVSRKFDTYLNTVKEGLTDDQVAREGGIR